MHAVILAGGKGVRLRPYTTLLPKPLVPIGEDHSIMEIALGQLAHCGFDRVTLAIGHLGQLIRSYIGDGSRWGLSIDYTMPEEMPLGTMGPVLRILPSLPEQFLVMNGDVLTDLDYADLMRRHRESGAPLTVAPAAKPPAAIRLPAASTVTRYRASRALKLLDPVKELPAHPRRSPQAAAVRYENSRAP